jgi:hypothetical protein
LASCVRGHDAGDLARSISAVESHPVDVETERVRLRVDFE